MSEVAKTILERVLALTAVEQLHVADSIYERLGVKNAESETEIEAFESDPEWQAELNRRLDFVEQHPDQLLDGQAVIAELRKRFL